MATNEFHFKKETCYGTTPAADALQSSVKHRSFSFDELAAMSMAHHRSVAALAEPTAEPAFDGMVWAPYEGEWFGRPPDPLAGPDFSGGLRFR